MPLAPDERSAVPSASSLGSRVEELRGVPTLLLSPHLDDALFSAHTLIAAIGPEVWTVFAGAPEGPGVTDWDRGCGFDDSRELMAVRRQEDRDAFADLPEVELRHLDLLERAYTDARRRRDDEHELRARIDQWLTEHPGERRVLLVPVGAGTRMAPGPIDRIRGLRARLSPGAAEPDPHAAPSGPAQGAVAPSHAAPTRSDAPAGEDAPRPDAATRRFRPRDLRELALRPARALLHRDFLRRRRAAQRRGILANEDHVALRDIVVAHTAGDDSVEVWFYEELPYLWGEPGDAEARRLAAHGPLAELSLPVDQEAKARRVRRYATQLGLLDPERKTLADASTLPRTERLWAPATGSGADEDLLPGITVVIPAHDAAETIGFQLEALVRQQDAPPFEVIVVDNRSRDDLSGVVGRWQERLPALAVVPARERTGAAYARNVGIGAARHEAIAFCDADDVVSAWWLRDLQHHLRAHPAVSGSARPLPSARFTTTQAVQDWLDEEEGAALQETPAPHDYPILMAGDCAFRTDLLRRLGGFDQSFVRGGEDNDLALRVIAAGEELIMSTGARLAYRDRPTLALKARKELWRGFMHTRLATRHRLWATSPHLGRTWFLELPRVAAAAVLMALRLKPADRAGLTSRAATATGILGGFVWHQVLGRDPGAELGIGFAEGARARRRAEGGAA